MNPYNQLPFERIVLLSLRDVSKSFLFLWLFFSPLQMMKFAWHSLNSAVFGPLRSTSCVLEMPWWGARQGMNNTSVPRPGLRAPRASEDLGPAVKELRLVGER